MSIVIHAARESLRTKLFSLAMRAGWGVAALGICMSAHAARTDPDYDRLRSHLSTLENDRVLAPLAPAQIALAEQALATLVELGGKNKLHDHLVFVAEQRIEIAYTAAQTVDQERKLQQLDREHDQILLAASRRDAEQARLELEKQRIQSQAQAEETDRLRSEADIARAQSEQNSLEADTARKQAAQARKLADAQAHEADLARREAQLLSGSGTKTTAAKPAASASPVTLSDAVFAPGLAVIKPAAQGQIAKIIASAGKSLNLRIEAHANDAASAKANLALSQQRARAVREALVAGGIAARRITVVGVGATAPASRHVIVSFSP